MSDESHYEALLPTLMAIPNDQVIRDPKKNMGLVKQRAIDLYDQAKKDFEDLEAAGLEADLLDSLPARAGAFEHAQRVWRGSDPARPESVARWMEAQAELKVIRRLLTRDLKRAFRGREDLMGRIEASRKGLSASYLIQRVNDLATLGIRHQDLLIPCRFDLRRLDEAKEKARQAAWLLALSKDDVAHHARKDVRDRAYTFLRWGTNEVRECGMAAYVDDADRRRPYLDSGH